MCFMTVDQSNNKTQEHISSGTINLTTRSLMKEYNYIESVGRRNMTQL